MRAESAKKGHLHGYGTGLPMWGFSTLLYRNTLQCTRFYDATHYPLSWSDQATKEVVGAWGPNLVVMTKQAL